MPTPLTISFVPGYTWTVGELVTADKLNLAANPAISLIGTISATSIGDGVITPAKLNASVAGDGISGGAGTALAVNVDGSTIEINADTLRVKDAGITFAKLDTDLLADATAKTSLVDADLLALADSAASNATKKITVANARAYFESLSTYASAELTFAAGVLIDAAHSLGAMPKMVRAVLVAQATPEGGYTQGDEIDASYILTTGGSGQPIFQIGASATNVFALCASTSFYLPNKTTGTVASGTAAKWKVKVYARL